ETQLAGHAGPVERLFFLPDGSKLVSSSADKTVQVWNLADGKVLAKLDLGGPIAACALTPDGTIMATGTAEKLVKLWNLAEAKAVGEWSAQAPVRSLAFSPDGGRLLVGGADGTLGVYLRDGRLQQGCPAGGELVAVSFLPDGSRFLTASSDKTIRVWSGSLVWETHHGAPLRAAATLPDAYVVGGDDKGVKLLQFADGTVAKMLLGHDGPVTSLAASDKGEALASASADQRVILWNLAENQPRKVVPIGAPVLHVGLSRDGGRVLVVGQDQQLRLVDVGSGQLLQAWNGHAGPITRAGLLPDGQSVWSVSGDKSARLMEPNWVRTLAAHPAGATLVALHPGGTQALTAGADKQVKLWDLTTGQMVRAFEGAGDLLTAIAFSPEATPTRVAAASADKFVRVWNLADGKELAKFEHPAAVRALAFSADASRLATGCDDHRARLYDLASGREMQQFVQGGPIAALLFHADQKTLVIGCADKTVAIVPIQVSRLIVAHSGPIQDLAVTDNGSHVATASDDGTAKLWNTANGQLERTYQGHQGPVLSVAITKNGVALITGGADQHLRIFNFADGKEVKAVAHPAPVRRVRTSPNNAVAIAACADKTVMATNIAFAPGQNPPAELGATLLTATHDGPATAAAFMGDPFNFLTGSADKSLRQWRLASDGPLRQFAGHGNIVDAVAFSPDGATLASASHDGTVRLWNVASGEPIASVTAFPAPIYTLAWSPKGDQLAAGSFTTSWKLIDVAAKAPGREFKSQFEKVFPPGQEPVAFSEIMAWTFPRGHREGIFSVAFSPDGSSVITAGSDGLMRTWNLADGTILREFVDPSLGGPTNERAHPDWIAQARFSPDGGRFISVGNGGWVSIWQPIEGKLIHKQKLDTGLYGLAFFPDGKRIVTANHNGTAYIVQLP
ncbi:MAG TPA: WD40 repeat domain-containing protein, partial [Gemmatales bacterium]|nr:WD40 repeat domain-containing protein [Gemmatales bacterium]